jgi:hypothetical protein
MAVSAAQILAAWERGLAQTSAQRALTLLEAACAGGSSEAVAGLSIGERDKRLLRLREQLFGPRLNAIAHCPICGEKLEFDFHVADLQLEPTGSASGPLTFEDEQYVIRFRLPQGIDLVALDQDSSTLKNRQHLVERCILSARCGGESISAAKLPDQTLAAVAEQMAKADPQADVLIAIQCPACMHRWRTPLDICAFLWIELNAWATGLLREVHLLATAYGWHESDILELGPTRRRFYLEMIEQ